MFSRLDVPRAIALLVSIAGAGCSGNSNPATPNVLPLPSALPPGSDRALFVGNSLTAANELPLIVEALAAAGGRPIFVESITYGGVSLEDHWGLRTQDRIAAGAWRWVVLQQGPSALPDSRANLREWTRRFDTVIRQQGGVTALYMVWPESTRREAFPDVSASYRLAAQDVRGILLPAGDAWLAAWRLDPSLPLYGPDGFHPSMAGSYLAALTIYGGLTGSSTLGLPGRFRLRSNTIVDVDAAMVPRLQAAADEALGR